MTGFRKLAFAIGMTAAVVAGNAMAQEDYPTRPIEFIVPWSPGGGSDTLMRIVSKNVEPHLGQAMAVVNMPGVSGTTGLAEAAQREPDGYTVAQIHEGLPVANATGLTDLNWDTFDLISLMTSSPQYLVVNADSEWDTFEEFAEYVRENPGEIRMGVTLAGVPHLHAAMIEDAIGGEFSYVGYEGTGERIRALVGGNLDAAIGDISSAHEFVKNGDLRFLATGARERLDATPDVPTFRELGHENLELSVTRGIVAPEGTPQERLDTLEAALRDLSEDESFVQEIQNVGATVDFRGQDAYREYMQNLSDTIGRLANRLDG